MSEQDLPGPNTLLCHSGADPQAFHGFVNPPVVRASTVLFPDAAALAREDQRYTYATHGTPTTDALCAAITGLEGAAGTVLVPSGLAAVTLPLLTFLSAGDHVLIADSIYGPTRRFADEVLPRFGISVSWYDSRAGADIARDLRPETRVIFLESPGSNTFEVQDIPAITAVARQRGIVTMIDNSWATPLFLRPLDLGVDISIHAATKYFSGHSDVLMGSISANEATWKQLWRSHMVHGHCVGGDDAYLVLRGLRTLGRRMAVHQASALEIAAFLETHPGVAAVHYPALPSHRDHALWKRDFKGASGLFSLSLSAGLSPERFLDTLKLFGLGYSYGGYESLAVLSGTAGRQHPESFAQWAGLPLIRLQIGLEDTGDLIADLTRALEAAAA